MSNIEPSYRPPLHKELAKEGLYSQWVSYKATDEIIAYMTSYGNPTASITNTFLKNNNNSLAQPVRLAISVYAYGRLYPQRFGNKLDNALYQSAIRLIRCIAKDNNRHTKDKQRIYFNNKVFIGLADKIHDSCKQDVDSILESLNPMPYDSSNGWYIKMLDKKNSK